MIHWRHCESASAKRLLTIFVLAALCFLAPQMRAQAISSSSDGALIKISAARATIVVNGIERQENVALPYHWDLYNKGQQGTALFEVTFDLAVMPTEPWGVFLPRLGNAYELTLNDQLLERQGSLTQFNSADYSQVPRLISIAPGLLQQSNKLSIRVRADVGRRGGLSAMQVAPYGVVRSIYAPAFAIRSTGSLLVTAFSFCVGLLALALWIAQTDTRQVGRSQHDPFYLYAGIAELAWTLNAGAILIINPLLPWPWWGVATNASAFVWMACMTMVVIHITGFAQTRYTKVLTYWLMLMVASSVIAPFAALAYGKPLVMTLTMALSGFVMIALGFVFVWRAARQTLIGPRLMALAFVFNCFVGLRDLYVFRVNPSYGEITWLRYSSVLFGCALVYVLVSRYRRFNSLARQQHELTLAAVAQREKELTQELSATYERLELLAREQERVTERTRILRDMHDGVGSHLSSAIRQIESGQSNTNDVLLTLRDSMDHLKLTVDSINLPLGDITSLLANLRYRLGPRFAASNIVLTWDVQQIEPLKQLDGAAMQQVQFIVFEALSNVLQHSGATELRIEAHKTTDGVRVAVIDNGCGFDSSKAWTNGLQTMQRRAKLLGAEFFIQSRAGRSTVAILFA